MAKQKKVTFWVDNCGGEHKTETDALKADARNWEHKYKTFTSLVTILIDQGKITGEAAEQLRSGLEDQTGMPQSRTRK